MSLTLNSSSGSVSSVIPSDFSSLRSIKVYQIKATKPATNKPRPAITGAERAGISLVPNQTVAIGIGSESARAVPIRAVAISSPIASANSFPLNHFTITLETVIPATSTPTPKIPKPSAPMAICALRPKMNASEGIRFSIAAYCSAVPTIIVRLAPSPVKRTPILSSMSPPKMSIRKKTLNQP